MTGKSGNEKLDDNNAVNDEDNGAFVADGHTYYSDFPDGTPIQFSEEPDTDLQAFLMASLENQRRLRW